MRINLKISLAVSLFALLECAWYFAFSRYRVVADMLVEKCNLRAEGDFYTALARVPEWFIGWLLAYYVPLIALCVFLPFLLKDKFLPGWIAVLSVQVVGALLAVVLTIQALITTSWALW